MDDPLADLPGFDLNGSTIPPDILITTARTDLVIIDRQQKKIYLLELTFSFESSANIRKNIRYNPLKTDLIAKGYECYLIPFEVGSRGYVSKSNKTNLMNIFLMNKLRPNLYLYLYKSTKLTKEKRECTAN